MRLFLSILFLAAPAAALAEKKSAVAVLDIQATGVDPGIVPTLTEVLTAEVDALGIYSVIGGRDIDAMLGFERQKEIVGCTDAACLAEIGGALGVERILASHIGKVGSTYVVNIKLINIRTAATEARVYETVRNELDALLQTIRDSVAKLMVARGGGASVPTAAAMPKSAPKPEPAATPAPQPHDELGHAHAKAAPAPPAAVAAKAGERSYALPIAFGVVGVVCGGLGAVLGMEANSAADQANRQRGDGVYESGAQRAGERAESLALFANISFAAAVGSFGIAAATFLLGGESGDAPRVAAAPSPDGGFSVVLAGGF